jgi:hypothetical protein
MASEKATGVRSVGSNPTPSASFDAIAITCADASFALRRETQARRKAGIPFQALRARPPSQTTARPTARGFGNHPLRSRRRTSASSVESFCGVGLRSLTRHGTRLRAEKYPSFNGRLGESDPTIRRRSEKGGLAVRFSMRPLHNVPGRGDAERGCAGHSGKALEAIILCS